MKKKHKKFGLFRFNDSFTESQRMKLRRARNDTDFMLRVEQENLSIDKKQLLEDYDRLKKALRFLNEKR